MKKIIKPAEKEESVFFTDFKGRLCGECGVPVELIIQFNYGSEYDGDELRLHLDDEEIKIILEAIKRNLSEDYKKHLKEKQKRIEDSYEKSVQFRDWTDCEAKLNSLSLIKTLIS